MKTAAFGRRKRRIFLLLSAILIPTAVVILLVFRVVRQDSELSERRAAEQRREALDQLRRELSARLQAIRVEEVNRLIGESGSRIPPDSPIVFVASLKDDRIVLPWEETQPRAAFSEEFSRKLAEAESIEFQKNDFADAASAYAGALRVARSPLEKCEARLGLGRAYAKAGLSQKGQSSDRTMLAECNDVKDNDGVAYALYASQRLISATPKDSSIQKYVIDNANTRQSSPLTEAYLLQSLLASMTTTEAIEAAQKMTSEIHEIEQINAFAEDTRDHLGRVQRAFRTAPGDLPWIGYGDEPWLITIVSPTSFATPIIMAVSSTKVVPAGATLHAQPAPGRVPLGDGFVDLQVSWAADRFTAPPGVPVGLYAAALLLILGATLCAAYLLFRDVQREVETAEMRSQFVASVSHELRTPLTAIRAVAETLLLGRNSGGQSTPEYLRTIVSESDRLTRLVDNVLDFSRIEQGRKIYRMESTQLTEVVREAATAMDYPLSQLGFTLTISEENASPQLHADADALKQAVLNLLGNAMKYSGKARKIEMRLGTQNDEAYVDVVDHGIGISPEDRARIFEKFHRVRSAETEGIAGTGLGLSLALHIIEAHNGRIEVSSDLGRGSTFSIRIPLQEHA